MDFRKDGFVLSSFSDEHLRMYCIYVDVSGETDLIILFLKSVVLGDLINYCHTSHEFNWSTSK